MDTTRSANGWRQTATLNYEISTMWEMKPKTTPQKTSILLIGPKQFKSPKTLQATLLLLLLLLL